mmetsp:Transcript_9758/g.59284  ORF Transcript_9758/g.59284 Transcript_9758/m.59284 type:complete len:211 (-) Transcript_9758:341-973(-)
MHGGSCLGMSLRTLMAKLIRQSMHSKLVVGLANQLFTLMCSKSCPTLLHVNHVFPVADALPFKCALRLDELVVASSMQHAARGFQTDKDGGIGKDVSTHRTLVPTLFSCSRFHPLDIYQIFHAQLFPSCRTACIHGRSFFFSFVKGIDGAWHPEGLRFSDPFLLVRSRQAPTCSRPACFLFICRGQATCRILCIECFRQPFLFFQLLLFF